MTAMRNRSTPLLLCLSLLAGCREAPPQALGTLEFDRVTLPAPVAERIVSVDVREGQRVAAGTRLLTLERTRTGAQAQAAMAEAQRQREVLAELQAGPRSEDIAQARASLDAALAQSRDADAYYARVQPLGRSRLMAAADIDRARAAAANAQAQVRSARAALEELERGTRVEQVAQGEAAVRAAQAQAEAEQATLQKLDLVAPREGWIDSLPYKLGDQAPVGAPLVVMLVGGTPYARVYVPVQQRPLLHVGDAIDVYVGGREQPYAGKVRMLRSEPAFTPYYALIGDDAARLSYLAEISLGEDAAKLPAGLPVRVEFPGSGK